MQRLHLLGFTHDLKGVVFSQRKGGKSATFWVPIDAPFVDAIEKLERARAERDDPGKSRSNAKAPAAAKASPPRSRALPPVGRSTARTGLSAKEIQQMLREGRTVETVAKLSKAPRAWVERLLEPVLAERDGVVRLAQRSVMPRPRLGKSGRTLGDSVRLNLEERGVGSEVIEALDESWDARASQSGTWRVWLRYSHRGQRRVAEWKFRKDTREVHPRNRLGSDLGWRAPEPSKEPAPAPAEGDGEREEGADRKAAPSKPTPRPASRAKTSRKPSRRARPRSRPATRSPARRRTAKRTTSKRGTAKRRPATRRPAKRRPAKRRPAKRRPAKRARAKASRR